MRTAWESRGYPWSDDIFSGDVDGMTHVVVSKYQGVRSNASVFVEGKSNITIKAGRHSRKILFKDGAAVGVEVSLETIALVGGYLIVLQDSIRRWDRDLHC